MPDQPRNELADYLLTAEIDTHIVIEQEDSVRDDWWRAGCDVHHWYTTGNKPNVEDAAAEHVAAEHKPCAKPGPRTFSGVPLYCRLLPGHDGDHMHDGCLWPNEPTTPDSAHDGPPAQPKPPVSERYHCPISTCSWVYDAPPAPVVDPGTLAAIFGPGVMTAQAVNHHRLTVGSVLEEHFNQHRATEYIAEINDLKDLNIGLIGQMQQLSEAFKDALKASPDLQREVDPAVQLTVPLGECPVTEI